MILAVDPGETQRLLRRALQGESRAREALLLRLRPRLVLWVATRLSTALRAKVEPEDVTQDVLIKAHKSLDGFQGDDERAFMAFLFRIAENQIRDYAAHFGALKRQAVERDGHVDSTPSAIAVRKEMCARVHVALATLSDDYRQVIQLVRLEEQPMARVAEIMDRTENAVRILYCRAMRALRAALPDEEGSR
jgi:RNA polymerase sigma-70 factor (ECF subfamily)